ncbi:MAG: LacI family transcriptional regulator [Lachnospiraceae bacterium]|nr:LacI family transcriptional regulator [Lachnospiraceae bacterium]
MQVSRTNENKAITIYDIAREAGVSPSTVSRVLTGSAKVRPEKKERVLQLIEKYNFKPNALARGLADTRSKVIGLLTADVRNPFYAALFVACEKAAHEAGYTLLSSNSLDVLEQEKALLEKLQEQKVDAIIQVGGSVDDLSTNLEYSEFVNQIMTTTPVIVTGKLDGTQCHMVQIDAMKVMDLLMEHLLSLNHRKIAMIGGSMDVSSTFIKVQRYKQILQMNKIDFCPELLLTQGSYNAESGYELMNKIFEQGTVPTAVVAINDFSAVGAVRSILEHGYRIPEDISVVSQDNTFLTSIAVPNLTSVDYDYEEFGRKLIATAIAVIEGKEVSMLQTVTPKLVIRQSSGIAKSASEI